MCEKPRVYLNEKRKARKNHVCSDCGGLIPEGEIYYDISGNWDGVWSHYKYCSDCDSIWNDLLDADVWAIDYVTMGNVGDYIFSEGWGDRRKDPIFKLAARYRLNQYKRRKERKAKYD